MQQQIYSHSDRGTTSAFVVRAVVDSGTESNQFFTDGAQNCCFKLTCLNTADFKSPSSHCTSQILVPLPPQKWAGVAQLV